MMSERVCQKESNRSTAKERTGSILACGSKMEFYRGVLSVSLKVMERTTQGVGTWGWS